MTDKELLKASLHFLLPLGEENAKKGSELAVILRYPNDRPIRIAIRELIAEGLPVGATTKPPFGYYIINTEKEANDYLDALKSRLIQDAYRRRDIKRATEELRNPHQMKLL